MTEDDKLIISGIITVLVCVVLVVILAVRIEKRVLDKKARLMYYAFMFVLGWLIFAIWPISTGKEFKIEVPTLIGLCFIVFTPAALLVTQFMIYESNIAKRMIAHATRIGEELKLTTHGIPTDPKTPFTKLSFSFSGLLNKRWNMVHYDISEFIPPAFPREKRKREYNYYYFYKLRLNTNTHSSVLIQSAREAKGVLYEKSGYHQLITRDTELNEKVAVFVKSDDETMRNMLSSPTIRKMLITHVSWFDIPFTLNNEEGIVLLKIRKGAPDLSMFERNGIEKEFLYHMEHRKEHLAFLTKFLEAFDQPNS